MRQRGYLVAVMVLLAAGLFLAQRRLIESPASGQAILSMIADSERELSHLPAKFTRLSDADEVRAGSVVADEYLAGRTKMSADDKIIESHVQEVGGGIARFARRKLPYRFHYIPDRDFINAFAVPGGHVFIGAGLIERMETDDELASVLGHEIEHIDHFHCVERLQIEAAMRKVPLAGLLRIPVAVFQAGYSKEQELEADREGVRLAARRGYSARGAIRLFEMFQRLFERVAHAPRTPQKELSGVAADILTGYFRSHPLSSERIAQIRAMIVREPALDRPEQAMPIVYIFLAWQALDKVREDKFAEAATLATRALQTRPDHPAALEALADAKFGSGDLVAGQAAYRALLGRDGVAAAAVAAWTKSRVQQLLEKREMSRAIALIRSLLDLQPLEPSFLRLLAIAQAETMDSSGAAETAQTLRRVYPNVAVECGDETAHLATTLLSERKFAEAASMAALSLVLRPEDPATNRTLGDAAFAQASFAQAAAAYQQLLNAETTDEALLRSFADALGSARPATAARELESLIAGRPLEKLPQSAIDTELSGLALLAASDDRANSLRADAKEGKVAPEVLARLGWWSFRAGRLVEARAILDSAAALRPSYDEISNVLGWVDLEEGKDAQSHFGTVNSSPDSILESSTDAGQAINSWRQRKTEDALIAWKAVRLQRPQWRLAAWRNAIYPPHIAAAVAEMEEALQRSEAASEERQRTRMQHKASAGKHPSPR